ncbi:MAG: DUF932 domain-containing protein [Bryobacterales bacterium]|nr:DUF932 domain-containing protein [Bryobacterales bacterium]
MSSRITDYRDLMFPVRTVGVFAEMCEGDEASRVRIPGKKAIVHSNTGRVISVVGRGYQLVTNEQALEYGFQCCEVAFPDLPRDSWVVSAADAPSSGGHCHIDLTHSSAAIQFDWVAPGKRPDTYGPFVRLTNSYNRMRALRFDIGFMRKVCKNGMILPMSSIRFSFNHNVRNVADRLGFECLDGRFQRLKKDFLDLLQPLRKCDVPEKYFLPITFLALKVRKPENPSPRQQKARTALEKRVDRLSSKYRDAIGSNGYALMNVVSDLATRPEANALNRRERHNLQRLAGVWLADFSAKCQEHAFDLPSYTEHLEAQVDAARTARAGSPSAVPAVI